MKPTKRFIVVKLNQPDEAYSVDDTFRHDTKAVFYDEASKELAEDFCRQMNRLKP